MDFKPTFNELKQKLNQFTKKELRHLLRDLRKLSSEVEFCLDVKNEQNKNIK